MNTTLNQDDDGVDEEVINNHLTSTDVDRHQIFLNLPESLANAIGDFIITGIIRDLRGQGDQHHTMLINTSHLSDDQDIVQEKVQQCMDHWSECCYGHEMLMEI